MGGNDCRCTDTARFTPQGVKINQQVHRESFLESGPKTFQREFVELSTRLSPSAQGHSNSKCIKQNWLDFISSAEWPPCLPDLYFLDYSMRSILDVRAFSTTHRSVKSLRAAIIREWDRIPPEYVRASINSFVGLL